MLNKGFLSANRTPEQMIVSLEEAAKFAQACRDLGLTVVYTQGSYDLKHVGHSRYLTKAKSFGDVLIVGVDSDEKIRERKGPNRPVVNQEERLEQLCYESSVNLVVLKELDFAHLALQKAIKPDVLVISRSTKEFNQKEIDEYREYCKQVEVLEPQAETSTTARVRVMMLDFTETLTKGLTGSIPEIIARITAQFTGEKPKGD